MAERNRTLVVRVDDPTLDMAHAIALADDVPVTQVIRAFIRDEYRARFGKTRPPPRPQRAEPPK